MRIGVGIISWDRPQYLAQLIESLEKNILTETNFHLFQDGAVCKFTNEELADTNKIVESIGVFYKSKLPNKHYHVRDKNVSVAINQFEAMQYLRKNYEQFIFLENDVIVSSNFMILTRRLLEQFKKDERVACISPGLRLLCKENDIGKNLNKLKYSKGHFWAEACWSSKWERVEKEYMTYYNIVKNTPYRKRDEVAIRALFARNGHKAPTTSQDQGKDWAIQKAGMKRARLIVNRATGIGDHGIHSTPAKLKKSLDGHNPIYVYKEELDIKEFKLG